MASASLMAELGRINRYINGYHQTLPTQQQLTQLNQEISQFSDAVAVSANSLEDMGRLFQGAIANFTTAAKGFSQKLEQQSTIWISQGIGKIESEFKSSYYCFPDELTWQNKIKELQDRIRDLKKAYPRIGETSHFIRLQELETAVNGMVSYKKGGVGIVDPNHTDPFVKFYRHYCSLVSSGRSSHPEQLRNVFSTLSSSEQWTIYSEAKVRFGISNDLVYPHDIFTHSSFQLLKFGEWLEKTYFQKKVNNLPEETQKKLHGHIFYIAKAEGVPAQEWEWGKHHLFDNPLRFLRALNALGIQTISDQLRFFYDRIARVSNNQIAYELIQNCPLLLSIKQGMLSDIPKARLCDELKKRAAWVQRLKKAYCQLEEKYSARRQFFNDSRRNAWKGQEMFFSMSPIFLEKKGDERFQRVISVVDELVGGKCDEVTAEITLDVLLTRESFHPLSADLENALRLENIYKVAKAQINNCNLSKAEESYSRDVFVIPSCEDKQGKFKPLHPCSMANEVAASKSDRVFGIGMTAPTRPLQLPNFSKRIDEIAETLGDAVELRRRIGVKLKRHEDASADQLEADRLKQRAITMLRDPSCPTLVRNAICLEMYILRGDHRKIEDLGRKLFFDEEGYQTLESEKITAIQNYLSSYSFTEHLRCFNRQGSLQRWIDQCGRGFDLLVKDPDGGRKLRTIPKALAHLYALLGMFKGSMDCSSGNTLVQFDPRLDRVVNLWDFDDEKSMPVNCDYKQLRMWQLGLPQCGQPFDRAILLLFSDPTLLNKLKISQRSSQISPAAYKAQCDRVEIISALLQEALNGKEITLSPRDLFFSLFGGKEEFDAIQSNSNGISPIEIFEFHFSEIGKGVGYGGNDREKELFRANIKVLYSPGV